MNYNTLIVFYNGGKASQLNLSEENQARLKMAWENGRVRYSVVERGGDTRLIDLSRVQEVLLTPEKPNE